MTETWLRKGDTSKVREVKDLGFNLIHRSRSGRGGGVAFIFKKTLKVKLQKTLKYKTFEVIEGLVESNACSLLRVCCIYRPGTGLHGSVTEFCTEFEDYLCDLSHLPGRPLIAGDFNVHMEKPNDPDTKKFTSLLDNFGLLQNVNDATHMSGGILDLVITCSNISDRIQLSDMQVIDTVTSSDHYIVSFSCLFSHCKSSQKTVQALRNIKKINLDDFRNDIIASDLNNPEKFCDMDHVVQFYNLKLSEILDKHAPIKEIKLNPEQSVWFDSKCQEARRKRRKAERNDKKDRTTESRVAWATASKQADAIINQTRDSYYRGQLETSATDKKKTYSIVNHLMDRNVTKTCLPSHKSDDILASEMKEFFEAKVKKIYDDIEKTTHKDSPSPMITTDFSGPKWDTFQPISGEELHDVIKSLNLKYCEQDPIPCKLFVQCYEELKPIVLFIVNESLKYGSFPSALKNAYVRPSIKKLGSDSNDYRNYRPVSNLPFLSKILEKVVQKQLNEHLIRNKLHAEYQSGYRADHSCETATLAVYNDLLCISDLKNRVVLLLLDLSAAFDTINHNQLLNKLKHKFGISGNVHHWFQSYLSGRSFTVTINQSKSKRSFLVIGVPQGSILGPILFVLFTKELEVIAKQHGFRIHLYADDTQLYIEFNPLLNDFSDIETKIIHCLKDIKDWMLINHLQVNTEKTKALLITKRNNFDCQSTDTIKISQEELINPVHVTKSLGVLFDDHLTFEEQIKSVVKSCYMNLRNLRAIASKLDFDLKKQLIHCLILSRIDYCNGLFVGLPDYLINKLQKVQNACVRLLFGKRMQKYDHVTPYLKEAHFLPVVQRIDYKIVLLAFKCINNIAPSYLKKLLNIKGQICKSLRNDDDYFLLDVPSVPNYKQTERAFSFAAPNAWNKLPYYLRTCSDIDQFKKDLKTYYFTKTFN